VEVVGHEAIGQDGHREFLLGLAKGLEEGLIVTILEEDLAVGVATVEDMVAAAADGGAGGAWHADSLARRRDRCKKKMNVPFSAAEKMNVPFSFSLAQYRPGFGFPSCLRGRAASANAIGQSPVSARVGSERPGPLFYTLERNRFLTPFLPLK
jgi:hypothetical protein